ncbi:MAG: class I adenylate-forming enzyme family protein [Planctomycetaceae bacterium]
MQLIDFFDRGAELWPERACFHDGQTATSYREVRETSRRIAAGLRAAGLQTGAMVAVYSPNTVRAFECILGILRAGCVWVPLNARNSIETNVYILHDSDCEWLFCHSDFREHAARILSDVPAISGLVGIGDGSAWDNPFEQWIAPHAALCERVDRDADDVAVIISTGGTTGYPKGVMLTHLNFETMIANFAAAMPFDKPPVHLVAAPITHAAGVMCFWTLAYGATHVIMPRVDLEPLLDNIQRFGVTALFLPPTAIYMLLAHPRVRAIDYSSLEYFVYGAAPMSADKLREAREVFGPVLAQLYGQAEAPMMCTLLPPREHLFSSDAGEEKRLSSCGRRTLLTPVEIMDAQGTLLGPEETGEIVVRGNLVMKGYYKQPELTAEVSRFGWHHTGDIGYKDAEGYVYIVDRAKDMIISGGLNVYPSEVERVIWSHPAVQDCAVIGVPDDKWGEAVKAVIELKPGCTIDEAEIISLCKQKLGSAMAPKTVEVWDALPRSPVGKVLKKEIRKKYWEGRERMV